MSTRQPTHHTKHNPIISTTTTTTTTSSSQPQLITLNYISTCQHCKCKFNNTQRIPYLFKCGHFFCKQCIETTFTCVDGITCPTDSVIAHSLTELKLLNDLIITTPDNNNDMNRCSIHKEEQLTHYMENTCEVLCVYCAFTKAKKHPHIIIKEIKDKHNEMLNELNHIIQNEQHFVKVIQEGLNEIKMKKENEEQKVNTFYEQMIRYYKNKQKEELMKINLLFIENERTLNGLLEEVSKRIEKCEMLKNVITNNNNMSTYNDHYTQHSLIDIIEQFNILIKTHMSKYNNTNNIHINNYHFIHEDETTITKLINTFTNIKNSTSLFTPSPTPN